MKDCWVLERHVDAKGILHSKRLIYIKQSLSEISHLFTTLTKLDSYFAIEQSAIDPQEKTLKIETNNITFRSIVRAKEVIEYKGMTQQIAEVAPSLFSMNPATARSASPPSDPDASEASLTEVTKFSVNIEVVGQRQIPFLTNKVEKALLTQGDNKLRNGIAILEEMLFTKSSHNLPYV